MELTIKERVRLAEMLRGQEGRIVYMKALRKAREALEIDEQDHEEARMEQDYSCPQCHFLQYSRIAEQRTACPLCKTPMQPGQQLRWDPTVRPREFTLGELATSVIVNQLKTLESQGKLNDDLVDLYDKFVEDGEA